MAFKDFNLNSYYNYATGRFLSEDPIGFDSGDTNMYRYVSNNPVVLIDPSGKIKIFQTLLGGLGVVAGSAIISQSGNASRIHPILGGVVAVAGGALIFAGGILVIDGLVDEANSEDTKLSASIEPPKNTYDTEDVFQNGGACE